jgi:hypothetical protein
MSLCRMAMAEFDFVSALVNKPLKTSKANKNVSK